MIFSENSALMQWMENTFMPIASKLGSQKHLVVIRDSFIAMMPIIMVGSLAVLINQLLNIPTLFGGDPIKFEMLQSINGNVWNGSLAIMGLCFAFSIGYNLAKAYNVNAIAGGLVTFASVLTTMNFWGNETSLTLEGVSPQALGTLQNLGVQNLIEKEGALVIEHINWGGIPLEACGSSGIFTAMIIGLITGMIYVKLMQSKITIKLPADVPPAVNKAFVSLIPGIVAVYVAAIITQVCVSFTGQYPNAIVNTWIAMPLLGLSQSFWSVIVVQFVVSLFWFFGLHGMNVMAPVIEGVYTPALLANTAAWEATHQISQLPYIWTRSSFDAYTMMGGNGATLGLILAIFLLSKREDSRTIAKLAAPMGVFNINEPITFGMPIVLNPLYFIPWTLVPVVTTAIAYGLTAMGVIPPCFLPAPWITPVGLYAFIATGGNLLASLVSVFNLFVSFAIWAPFVVMANRIKGQE